ncbi:MAG: lipocalin family protein [Bacteroidia bacterium]|nr:lipocalin family protein [Bacteroidia bacterium]
MKSKSFYLSILIAISVLGCNDRGAPLPAVLDVDMKQYEGLWFEIARLPNSFEKDLKCVTTDYKLLENGGFEVINNGYNEETKKVVMSKSKAWYENPKQKAKVEMQFENSFTGFYWIMALDSNYHYAMIGHPSRDYLWILSRSPKLDILITTQLVKQAKKAGFETRKLQWVNQDCLN